MNCQQAKEMMFAYVKGELDENEAAAMRAHLETCEHCTCDLEDALNVLALMESASDARVVQKVRSIIKEALEAKASDIHLEPTCDEMVVRCRVDGVLHELRRFDKQVGSKIVARIKVMADLNIAEQRLPQDGRIPIKHEEKEYDLRVSTLPTIFGESAVLRILDHTNVLIGLDKLGLYPDHLETIRSLIRQPARLVIVAGPTGSGKTTMQYSMLQEINSPAIKILTIEDPVEFLLPGVVQAAVNRKAGMTYATAARTFLRQDPDVLMVGEMRDLEVAEICVQAAMTGHMVISSLYSLDAPSSVVRLVDMGVEPFLISASVVGVVAVRLARLICWECKEKDDAPDADALNLLGISEEELDGRTLYRGKGCDHCCGTGYHGRTGILEVMVYNAEIGNLVARRAPLREIREAALASGMISLAADAKRKVLDGITTAWEAARVVAV